MSHPPEIYAPIYLKPLSKKFRGGYIPISPPGYTHGATYWITISTFTESIFTTNLYKTDPSHWMKKDDNGKSSSPVTANVLKN
jgi:hypothetical protein